jgi:DNA helicase II / ATP-dependent DNA helicase PcrA
VLDQTAADALLSDLTPAQRRAVTSEASPLCVLAGAGAGKTRVLTRRVAYRVTAGTADPARVLALTFTRKAAGELVSRLRATGLRDHITAGTFHAVATTQLRRWWADRGQTAPTLLDRKARVLGPLTGARPALAGIPVAELAGHIEWAKARLVAPGELGPAAAAAGRALPCAASDIDSLYERYEHEKRRRGLVDFDDLLAQCADAIDRDPVFAAAQRWRWRHVFVDEFQDLNPLQHRLLLGWIGSSRDLCVVGDPNQAIYGWNGANPGLLEEFPESWPGTEVVRLDTNHRCSPQIVAAAASVLGRGPALSSSRADGPAVSVRSWTSEKSEATGVAAALRRAHLDGRRWSQLAVLVRTNAQTIPIADACRAAGVPVRTPGSAALLEHPAVRRALGDLGRGGTGTIKSAVWDLDEMAGSASRDLVDPPRPTAVRTAQPPRPRFVGPAADTDDASALSALADLARYASQIDEGMTVRAWLDWLPVTLGRDGPAGDGDAVTICSFHRAKGLEWLSVWICGLEAGLTPIGHASGPAALAEERRLLYVALTRAETDLHCSWAQERTFGVRAIRREPSPWLSLIAGSAPVPAEPERQISPEEWQRRLIAQRDRLRAGRTTGPAVRGRRRGSSLPGDWPRPDQVVLDALRAWRSDAARAAAVPAHVVLHDTTIEALAALRPSDQAGLLTVPGLGPVKVSRYGATLLALVARPAVSA